MPDTCPLQYHSAYPSGKIAICLTKPLEDAEDLSVAYSPGVAAPCLEIARDPSLARKYTAKGNLVAVITNGTAVLGLGSIGPLASKPVMEGKAALFKALANVDAFDIEINATDIDHFVGVVRAIEPTFGAINLEDIKAPDCFEIEDRLKASLDIPVFHDDQHGTAIVVASAILNYLRWSGKRIEHVKIVVCGAGAAAIACLDLLSALGLKTCNIVMGDAQGLINQNRKDLHPRVSKYAMSHDVCDLKSGLAGADIFLGLSVGNAIQPEWIDDMADTPLVLALANPNPDVCLTEVARRRRDAIIGSGRSDSPNQVNNVVCFPYIFRGALDAGAKVINTEMMIAATQAIADLADADRTASRGLNTAAAIEYKLVPGPLDKRLCLSVAKAVYEAAIESGAAQVS